jgi:hypothetical protein
MHIINKTYKYKTILNFKLNKTKNIKIQNIIKTKHKIKTNKKKHNKTKRKNKNKKTNNKKKKKLIKNLYPKF